MEKPNLFLVGAMKSGSTTLHDLLAEHPAIAMSNPKEPCYFLEPAVLRVHWPEMWARGIWKDEANYLALFPAKPQARYRGESSTDYSKAPGIPGCAEKIFAYNPAARIIYIMRDPVDRTLSHYWHMAEHRGETRAPLDAITQDPQYMDVSHYARQLEPYLSRFGHARVCALTFEALRKSPHTTIRDVFTWLGVEPGFVPPNLGGASNVTPQTVRQTRAGFQALASFRRSRLWSGIGRYVPAAVRRLGVKAVEKPVRPRTVDVSDVVAYLRPRQREQTARLAALLGREFDEWTTLYGD